MKKLFMILSASLIMLSLLIISGCEKSSNADTNPGEIGIEILTIGGGSATDDIPDSVTVGGTILLRTKLTGFTFEYYQVNCYFGESDVPASVFSNSELQELALTQEKDAEFDFNVSTLGLDSGVVDLVVEAVSKDLETATASTSVMLVMPTSDDSTLDMVIAQPAESSEFRIGDAIEVTVNLDGNLTLFDNLSAYIGTSTTAIFSSNTADLTKTFDFSTEDFAAGVYSVRVELTLKDETVKTRTLNFSLVEYIPTFTINGASDGYQIKSLIQTYDNGYLAVSA